MSPDSNSGRASIHDLNGRTMLSKVDLKWGFRQIFLFQESRHINMFATHQLMYRYKRLLFGVTWAPEKVSADNH